MNLANIFSRRKLSTPVDLSVLLTDMHSHLIPDIDDGAKTMEESLELIRQLSELGYKKLIITPHVMNDYYKNTPDIILKGLEDVKNAVDRDNIPIKIEVGAEYLIDQGFVEKFKNKQLLTFGQPNKNYLLIEFSFFNAPKNIIPLIFDLQVAGYKVILAHPERYLYWFDDFDKFKKLKEKGVLFQINIISLSGYYSVLIRNLAEKFIKNQMVDFLGTDIHNNYYLEGLKKSLYERYLDKIISSGKILNSTL
jgi:tyrosine-protein phosphatase YwqE